MRILYFENSGTICKIQCPDCESIKKISSYVNKDTGKSTFSVFNFSRHYSAHSNREAEGIVDSPDRQNDEGGESSKQSNLIKVFACLSCGLKLNFFFSAN